MEPKTPSLAELIEALPADAMGDVSGTERAPARVELKELLEGLRHKPIPTGRLTRLWSLGTLQAKVGAAYFAWWLRSGFMDADKKRRGLDETHIAAAIQVLGRMSYLRGAVMKLGQVIAHWPNVLPGSFAEVLGRVYAEAPPMHFALLREHARRELGADLADIFDDFESEAFAAASLGQVHRARIKGTDRRVAIKIQYPDIARTIRDDLRNLKSTFVHARLSSDFSNLLLQYEGIQTMLEAETNYEQEAENMRLARNTLSGLNDVVVPKVLPEYSTRRILTMEYLDGQHLEAFKANSPTQALRNRHAEQISRTICRLWYQGRMIYADPHPGNFLFLPDGRLGLLDFGCCHHFSDEEFAYVMEVEHAAHGDDPDRLDRSLARGCDLDLDDMSEERRAKMREYCDWLWEPVLTDEAFDFGRPDQFKPGVQLYGDFVKRRWTRSLPVNVWLSRTFFGVRAMLTHLEAKLHYGRIMREESAGL